MFCDPMFVSSNLVKTRKHVLERSARVNWKLKMVWSGLRFQKYSLLSILSLSLSFSSLHDRRHRPLFNDISYEWSDMLLG